MGTKEGGEKAKKVIMERYGEDFYRKIGKKGGKKSKPTKGFATNGIASQAGKKGGQRGKRGKKLIGETETHLIYLDLKSGREIQTRKESQEWV